MYEAGVAFNCLEPQPTQLGRSRLRDLGHPEPEPPNKVAAPQQCQRQSYLSSVSQIRKSFQIQL